MRDLLLNFADSTGNRIRSGVRAYIDFQLFVFEVFRQVVRFRKQRQISSVVLLRQILFTGYEAFTLISLVAAAIGGLVILQGNSILSGFGQSRLMFVILVSIITRELGSLITAFIIIARSGTAIATELGNMVINREVDVLLSTGISPLSYLVVPRMIGVVVSSVVLNIYFNLTGILGGWAVSNFFSPLDFNVFFQGLLSELLPSDIAASVFKSFVFGLLVALISCYQGLMVNTASTEVPQRTIKAVVQSLTWVIVSDILISVFLYFL